MNILMLYPKFPEQTFWNTAGSIKFMLGRKAIMPPLGLLTIASYLPQDFSLRLIDRNVSEEAAADWDWADIVVISLMLAQQADYRRCVSLAKKRGKPIALGGPFTHAMPEIACADADWVCFGEAETIIEELVSDLRAGRRGQRYQGGSGTDMESVRVPRFELLPNVNDYATMALQFSRYLSAPCPDDVLDYTVVSYSMRSSLEKVDTRAVKMPDGLKRESGKHQHGKAYTVTKEI